MKSAAKSLWICLLALGLNFMPVSSASAQTYTATVTGTVSDPQGASVAGVKVTATNQGTKLEYTAQTSESGVYTIPFLPVGAYKLTVESNGFKKLVSNEIKLDVNQTARIDLQLQVGGVNEVVNIEGVGPVLQTENVTVGQVISGNTTTNLPLNGRSFQQLTLLTPGAITPAPTSFTTPQPNGAGGRPYVNGNREQGNAFLLDGISVDETLDNLIGYKPSIDAIAEFRVETSNSSSEFGNVTGATVNATLKSGTNNYHGDVFEFLRNDKLDAQSWANDRSGVTAKPKLRQNIYGGTFGGPIVKEKTFFFIDYQGAAQRTGGAGTIRVAPLAWRQGDLSSISKFIRDPLKAGACSATDQTACFPGGIIPPDRIVNPVAKALFADPTLYPAPNRIDPSNGTGILDVQTASQYNGSQFDIRIDQRFSERDNVSGRYSFGNFDQADIKGTLAVIPTGKSFSRPQNGVINWTHTFSPTVINEARVGLNRAVFLAAANDWANIGNGDQKLGIPGAQLRSGVSSIALGNGLTTIGSVATDSNNSTNTFLYGDDLTILRGRHSFKMGGQLQRYQQNRFYAGNNGLLGYFTYNATFTGQAFASFLLDQVAQKGIGGGVSGTNRGTWGHRQNRIGFFFQDDFKVRNNLTLNLGVRWEYTSPVVEVDDRQANFDIATGKEIFAGQNGASRALYNPYYKGFEPRIGLAWTPKAFQGKFVVRAGYGITQYMEGTGSNLRLPLNPPFFSEVDVPYDPSSGPGTITKGFTDIVATNTIAGQLRIWNPDLRPQFTQQYNLTLEYQLFKDTSVSAAYVGHWATHLVAPTDINQPLPGVGPASTWIPFQNRRPLFNVYPLVTQTSVTDSWAISRYNSLQLDARQRLTKGLEFLASYTLSKTMTDNLGYYGSGGGINSTQSAYSGNAYDRHDYNYGPAFFDARHNFVVSGTYELPFGKGRAFGNSWSAAVNAIAGGWNAGSIVQWRTGFPITVNLGLSQSLQAPRGSERPNLIAVPAINTGTPDCFIYNPNNKFCTAGGTQAFSLPDLGTFGSAGVGIFYGPGFFNWDSSLGKKFHVTETKYFDFRAEFFNFTNHPNFNGPDRSWTPTSTTFGQITSTLNSARNMEFALKFYF
ncbi:MAG: TonB-dependent receptor [Chloracidobacterium sp.]|nr:TonB-dependent receptor [Chloracidobacterium sp.]